LKKLSLSRCVICMERMDFVDGEKFEIFLIEEAPKMKCQERVLLKNYQCYTEDEITFFSIEVKLRTGFTYRFIICEEEEGGGEEEKSKEEYSSESFTLEGKIKNYSISSIKRPTAPTPTLEEALISATTQILNKINNPL